MDPYSDQNNTVTHSKDLPEPVDPYSDTDLSQASAYAAVRPKCIVMCARLLSALSQVAAWLSGNTLVLINVVALRRARLVLGWVTVRG